MTEPVNLHEVRQSRDAAAAELHQLRNMLTRAQQQLNIARRRGEEERIAALESEIESITDRRNRTAAVFDRQRDLVERVRAGLVEENGGEIGRLRGALPILLLPIRLETHFHRQDGQVTELLLRIYPDDVHVDSHEAELTDQEAEAGRAYWQAIWRAAGNVERQRTAWRILAEILGEARAAWVARQTAPTNVPPVLNAPLSPDEPLPVEPNFPEPARKAEEWSRAPQARALPDRWIALGYRDGQRLFFEPGSLIPDSLALGPDPTVERDEDEDLFVDDASRWTIDFDRAVDVGMGIRIQSTAERQLDDGLDLLLVIGVKASSTPDEGAEMLTQLFQAHSYSEGLAFLRRWVPTNNTEPERSGWSDRSVIGIDAAPPDSAAIAPGDSSNAGLWAAALGLNTEQAARAFAEIGGAADLADQDARAMNAALWPATWGYLLEHMAWDDVRPHILALRRHAVEWLRAGGYFASLRAGAQPYGILAVTDLERYPLGDGERSERLLLQLLRRLQTRFWLPAVQRVPRVGRTGDPERDLVEILGQQAVSSSYVARPGFGSNMVANLWNLLNDTPVRNWWTQHQAFAQQATDQLGVIFNGRLQHLSYFFRYSDPISILVQAGEVEPDQLLDPNYIDWLLTHGYTQIRQENFPAAPPNALLYFLLRQSALLELARQSVVTWAETVPEVATMRFEPELVDMRPGEEQPEGSEIPAIEPAPDMTLSRVLDTPIPGVTDGVAVGAYLAARRHSTDPNLAPFAEFWDALDHLKNLPIQQLEYLLRETLDLSSHRLDAWLSSYSTRLLLQRRANEETAGGVYIGGFGWLEDLRPRTEPRSDGYVQAPSNDHAVLASVLRSAYLSHRASDNAGAFAIDLSSERVRLADWILEGIRAGHPLGALMGYRFERALHEQHPGLELDTYIYALRERAPLVAGKLEPTLEPFEAVAAGNVVDGHLLVRRWQKGQFSLNAPDLPPLGSEAQRAIIDELEGLSALIDAIGDALLAESVFQVGNPARLGATVDALASGDIPPPDLEFARTPHRGVGVVHRLAVVLPADAAAEGNWTADSSQIRAVADPTLNVWAAMVLGSAANYRFGVRYLGADDQLLGEATRSLADLPMSALDVVYLADGEDPESAVELLALMRHHARLVRPPGVPANARIELQFDVAGSENVFPALLETSRALRQVISHARPLNGTDLTPLGDQTEAGIDLVELDARANRLVNDFAQLETGLQDFLTNAATASLDALRNTLVGLFAFGFRDVLPVHAFGGGPDARDGLTAQAKAVAQSLAARRRELDQEIADFDPATADRSAQIAHARARARAVLSAALPVLPRFTASTGPELAQSLADADALHGGDQQAAVMWLQRMARVRQRVADINDVLLYKAALNLEIPYPLHIAQLPFRTGSRWGALPGPVDPESDGNRLSLMLIAPDVPDPLMPLSGLVVDEWSETIPDENVTTAATFHYDQPGARAANALLLAVAPEMRAAWQLDTLEKIVLDTLELTKIRCVDGDALQGLGQFLPALLFARNRNNDTVSLPFERMLGTTELTIGDS